MKLIYVGELVAAVLQTKVGRGDMKFCITYIGSRYPGLLSLLENYKETLSGKKKNTHN
jgi:hypothetical protein